MSRVPDRVPPGPIKLTYEDYVDLPDDGRRYEILDGELEVSPAPAPRHQAVLGNLLWILHGHVQERGLGRVYCAPIDVILAPTSVVQPDLIFIAAGRESIVTERAIEGSGRQGRALRPPRHPALLGRGSRRPPSGGVRAGERGVPARRHVRGRGPHAHGALPGARDRSRPRLGLSATGQVTRRLEADALGQGRRVARRHLQ